MYYIYIHIGSYEKWSGTGRNKYNHETGKNSWDNTSYHCHSINTSISSAKNTIENLVVHNILETWGVSKTAIQVLHTFKYLAPFYRLKYGFCGKGVSRVSKLDCVHFCAWVCIYMYIYIW
jgi:hypothetical protein